MNFDRNIDSGDVFRFGQSTMGWGYGQILISRTLQFVVIFEPVFQDADNPIQTDIIRTSVLLAGWTMDGRIQNGSWEIVGKTSDRPAFQFPQYRVEMSGKSWVTDVEGQRLREASSSERVKLKRKSSHSPIAYENAFWAYHTNAWEERFEVLRVAPKR